MREKQHQSITADLDNFSPMGDMVLVKRLPDPEETKGGLHIPSTSLNENRPKDPVNNVRRGLVIAVGFGDKAWFWICGRCEAVRTLAPSATRTGGQEEFGLTIITSCECGARDWQSASHDGYSGLTWRSRVAAGPVARPMELRVGDTILWQRRPNNEVIINEEEYTLLHEESQVLAVLDEVAA